MEHRHRQVQPPQDRSSRPSHPGPGEPDERRERQYPPNLPASRPNQVGPERAAIQVRQEQHERERKREQMTLASLPPAPQPAGVARLFSVLFGGPLMPLRFFWSIARWLWLAAGLLVIGAALVDYLENLLTGSLPSLTEAFFSSPVLEVPSRHPYRFMAGAAVALVLTVLAWGATYEHRRRLNARAERVRQAIRSGLSTDMLDEEMRAALVAGDSFRNFQLATQLHELNRQEDAVLMYREIVEQEPKHFGANYNLGLICAETGQFEAAEGYCRTAVLLNQESSEAQGLAAYVLYRLGFLEEAQRRARLAVRMGFSSQMLESLILPGLGVTSTMPTVGPNQDKKW